MDHGGKLSHLHQENLREHHQILSVKTMLVRKNMIIELLCEFNSLTQKDLMKVNLIESSDHTVTYIFFKATTCDCR
jgi:hypothetical protein